MHEETKNGHGGSSVDKRMSLKDAVSRFIIDGDALYYGGFQTMVPMAITHEMIRQRKKDLSVFCTTTDVGGLDLLVSAGCVREVHLAWSMNWFARGSHGIRRAFQQEALKRYDLSNFAATSALMAGFFGIPFMAVRGNIGTDLVKYNQQDLRVIDDPFTGEKITLVRSWRADVGIIHAQRADPAGNIVSWGTRSSPDEFGAMGSKRGVIVTVEEIVAPEVVRSDPDRTLIPFYKTLAVVHCPWGAHPSACMGYYGQDIRFCEYQGEYQRNERLLHHFFEKWVDGCPDHEAYLQKYVQQFGTESLERLKPKRGFRPVLDVHYTYHDPAVWLDIPPFADEYIGGQE